MANQPYRYQNSISSHDKLFSLRLGEIWGYRDLLTLLVKRDFVSKYRQTVLGPVWFFIQPIFQTIVLAVVFGGMAGLSTEGIPPILFYSAGVTAWNYFANCLRATSNTFTANAALFGKVYFPRAIMPISVVMSNLIQFGIGMIIFAMIYAYFVVNGYVFEPNRYVFLLPVLILIMGVMGLGFGMLISAMTTRYRDFQHLVEFGVQLLMYATPVIIPLSAIPERFKPLMLANPMTGVVEMLRFGFFGSGTLSLSLLVYSVCFTVVVFFCGLGVFNKTEKNFFDTV